MSESKTRSDDIRVRRLQASAIAACPAGLLIGLGSMANALDHGTGSLAEGVGNFALLVVTILFLIDWIGLWLHEDETPMVDHAQQPKGK